MWLGPAHPNQPPTSARHAIERRRRQEHARIGNHLATLGCGPNKKYACVLPLDGGMVHPGLIMPSVMQTTQGLFGTHPNKSGTTGRLASVARSVPGELPRYMCHDAVSMSSNSYSNFRKTRIAIGICQNDQSSVSEYQAQFWDPNQSVNARNHSGGARGDIWGRSGMSLCSGSSRLAAQII